MDYEKLYKEALDKAREYWETDNDNTLDIKAKGTMEHLFPELAESEEKKILKELVSIVKSYRENCTTEGNHRFDNCLAWLEKLKVLAEHGEGLYYFTNSEFTYVGNSYSDVSISPDNGVDILFDKKPVKHISGEKQGSEPNWCHHKVDLSDCAEEYRKAYYDGWNNCNQQHSQCNSEGNDVVKCLINGMKFYYEGNEEATWGTEKFPMKVKDILSWLEKQRQNKCIDDLTQQEAMDIAVAKCFEQGKQNYALDIEIPFGAKDSELHEVVYLIPEGFHAEIEDNKVLIKKGKQASAWSKEDELMLEKAINFIPHHMTAQSYNEIFNWFKSLKNRISYGNS